MIKSHNRSQFAKAILFAIGGLFFCWVTYLFFRYLPTFVSWQMGHAMTAGTGNLIGLAGLAVSWFSGYRIWKHRGGLFSYHESGLYHDLGEETSGAAIAGYYAHRITGPAYILGQAFMAGPIWILKSWTLLRSRIPYSAELDSKLASTLEALRIASKWQGLHEHPAARTEILYLAQMGHIDFSAHNGIPRFKDQ